MTDNIRLIIADDHQIFLDGLRTLFNHLNWIELVDYATDGDTLIELVQNHLPTIALIDLSMPGAATETIIEQTEQYSPSTKLIALTMSKDAYHAQQLLTLGLSGYVLKDTAFEDLLDAIKEVSLGNTFISPLLIDDIRQSQKERVHLTAREHSVLKLAAQGLGNKQIAWELDISERTVCFHMANCFIKLNVKNRSEAIVAAINQNLIEVKAENE